MKKRIALFLAAMMAVCSLAGCGSESGNGEVYVTELKLEDYVELGDYRNLNVTVANPAASEEDVETQALSVYQSSVTADNGGVKDRAVEIGDTVIINYEGKKDGVAFDGGTAQNADLAIGSGQFIDGFEDGLVGVMPGETVDLNLTFPENYGSTDLAGEDVVFTVTVNYIVPTEMEDEVVAGFGSADYATVEELKDYARATLDENAKLLYQQNVENAVLEEVVNVCTFKQLPEKLVAQCKESAITQVESQAASIGLDAETLVTYFYNTDLETYATESAEQTTKMMLAVAAVGEKQGLVLDNDALDVVIEQLVADNGWASKKDFLAEYDKEAVRENQMLVDTLAYLVENAIVSEPEE